MPDDLYRAIGRIEEAVKNVQKDTSEIRTQLENHNNRLSAIEGFKIQVLTIAGLVGAGVSMVWDLIKTKFGA
jgi:tRNA A22 N-methylase